jgi:hypothetical protein
MALFLHNNRLEPPLEDVADPAVPPVEGLGVDAVQLAHFLFLQTIIVAFVIGRDFTPVFSPRYNY